MLPRSRGPQWKEGLGRSAEANFVSDAYSLRVALIFLMEDFLKLISLPTL